MTDQPESTVTADAHGGPARLEADAIGAVQDTVIGMANSAPTVSVGLTVAGLAATAAYAVGPVIVLTAIPMLIIANAYRRLNLWNANCGASFQWVGRSINPYVGFLTGWLMITGSLVGGISGVVVLAPSVLAIFNSAASSTWPNIGISTAVIVAMLVIAVVGIKITARTQVGMAAVEYVILKGIGGKGSLAAGFLTVVFMYTGWDATVYVNEETTHRHRNPGRAAVIAVALLAVIYTVSEMGLQGVVSPARLQANSAAPLIYIAQSLGGGGWAKVMALSLALSVIASTGTVIVVLARMVFGMARDRVLPPVLAQVNRRFATPVVASVVIGVILIAATWVYLLSTSIANVFDQVIAITGLLYAGFYILTALAAVTYYRRFIFSKVSDALMVGILPLAGAGFLVWIIYKALASAPASEVWSVVGIVAAGVILMLVARFVLRSPFFQLARESAAGEG